MISHALTIVVNELNAHLKDAYEMSTEIARLGNPSDGFDTSNNGISRDSVIFPLSMSERKKRSRTSRITGAMKPT
ncbi:hypothetical protein NY406_05420 [Chlorobaculum sp. MV4-Y]|uniref:hypothetical protein n=1 Tax=Chlorobaculum sp. MV4-Y TaxID=2976335 RepID=UPI0021AF9DE7|nr:hypothetical protein [Chlorobaculum sp. MV4-Y]UWX58702.1 hypothetical protein NY406_05420 [Chlorobaculum sp. MV4-Y]